MSAFPYFHCNTCYTNPVSQDEKLVVRLDPGTSLVGNKPFGDIDDIVARFRSKSGGLESEGSNDDGKEEKKYGRSPIDDIIARLRSKSGGLDSVGSSDDCKEEKKHADIIHEFTTWACRDEENSDPVSFENIPEHMYARRLRANDPNLTVFRFERSQEYNDINQFVVALEHNTELQHLALNAWQLDDDQIELITNSLVSHPKLEILDLSDNCIGSKGLSSVVRLFQHYNVIKKLHLTNNQLGDIGATVLAEALQGNKQLQEISLSGNGIGDEGVAAILNTLEHSETAVLFLEIDYINVSDRTQVEDRLNRLLMNNRRHIILPSVAKNIRLLDSGYEGPNSPKKMSTGCRGMGEAAAKAMATSLRKCTWLHTLDLTNQNTIGDEGAIAFANALRENSTIRELFLGGNLISDRGAQAFVNLIMDGNTTIHVIDLSDNDVSQELSDKLKELLERNRNGCNMGQVAGIFMRLNTDDPTLQQVFVNNKEIGRKSGRRLATAARKNTYVKLIDISDNNLGDIGALAFAEMLRENESVESLILKNNGITNSGGKAILAALHTNKTVTHLELGQGILSDMEQLQLEVLLERNRTGKAIDSLSYYTQRLVDNDPFLKAITLDQAGDDGLRMLSGALMQNQVLTELYLTSNGISNKGVTHLAVALENNKSLREISLYGNSITDTGAQMLLYVMETNNVVTYLDLRKNEISQNLLEKIDSLTKRNRMNKTVQKLAVSHAVARLQANDRSLTDINLHYDYLGDEGAMIYAGALRGNTSLVCLNLSHASIGDSGAQILASAVHDHPTLTILSLAWNDFRQIGVSAVALALRKNSVINDLDLSGCRGEDAGATSLLELLLYNKNIHKLAYDATGVPECTVSNIEQLLKRNNKAKTIYRERPHRVRFQEA